MSQEINRFSNPLEQSYEPTVRQLGEELNRVRASLEAAMENHRNFTAKFETIDQTLLALKNMPAWRKWLEGQQEKDQIRQELEDLLVQLQDSKEKVNAEHTQFKIVLGALAAFRAHWLPHLNS